MKFRSVSFRCFGAFDERTLDFPDDGRNLHILFGPNEAGKSTALAGLTYFLFGFPTRVTHDFRYKSADQRLAATLLAKDGTTLEAVRRRTKNPLRGPDDKPLADDALRPFLGSLDKSQFELLFGLDHDQLVEGGADIATGRGELGQALFAAGTGLAGLRKVDERLAARLGQLYKRSGQNPVINAAFKQLTGEKDALRDAVVAVDVWQAQRDQLETSVARQKSLEDVRAELRAEENRLKTFKAALPTLVALATNETQAKEFADAPPLPHEFGATYRTTIEERKLAEAARDRHQADVARHEESLAALPPESQVLAEADAIAQIKQDLGAIVKADQDRDPLHARMREHQGEAHNGLLACFGRERTEDPESLRISQAEQDRIRSLGETRAGLVEAVQSAQRWLAQSAGQIADLERALAESPVPADETELDRVDRELLQEGPLEKTYNTQREEFREELKAAEAELARLAPHWTGPIKAVVALRPPSIDRIANYEKLLAQIDSDVRDHERDRDQHAKTLRDRQRRLDEIKQTGRVPDDADLKTARGERDAAVDRLASGEPIADEVRAAVRRADGVADRMRESAAQVSDMTRFAAERRSAQEEYDILDRKLTTLAGRRDELLGQWAGEWAACNITPAEPGAMRGWHQHWSHIVEWVKQLDATARKIKRLGATIDDHKTKLRAALPEGAANGATTLDQLHAAAKRTIDAARTARAARNQIEAKLRDARIDHGAAEREVAAAERSLAQWRDDWSRAVAIIGLKADDEPATANRYLDALGKIFQHFRNAETIELRLKGIDRDRGQFLERLTALRGRLGDDSPVDPDRLDVAVDELVRRLNDASARQREREVIEKSLADARKSLGDDEQAIVKCQARLQALGEQAGFASVEELPILIGRAEQRRELEKKRAELRETLRHHDDDVDAFIAAAESARPTLDARLTDIHARLTDLDREIPVCAVAADAARKQIDQWRDASSRAADHQQAIESLLAQLREQLAEYASIHLARHTLRLAIDRFRQRRHDSLLSNAARFFRVLTRSGFVDLEVEEPDAGEARLVAVRAEPRERVAIDELSEGTRDQLFLALRLAGIEQHIRSRGPMPVIVDDILVNFDEAREAATLECLAELSKETQVLLFTHHAHVVEIAKRVAPDAVRCHDLTRADPTV